MIQYWIFPTPLGDAGIVAGKKGICRLLLPGWNREKMINYIRDLYPASKPGPASAPKEVESAINFVTGYFLGSSQNQNAKLDLSGLTEFQKKVLKIVARIKPGETKSYGWVAEQFGDKKAVRAVAQALAKNPLPLFIPCHRVVSQDGSLRGFSAPGGVNLKRSLLNLETPGRRLKAKP